MAIAKFLDFFNPNFRDIQPGNYLVFEEAYQAEILDWFKSLNVSTAEKDRLIHSLIHFEDNCAGFYDYRAYFLAVKYIEVFPNSSFADELPRFS